MTDTTSLVTEIHNMQEEEIFKGVASQTPLNDSGPLWMTLAAATKIRDSDPEQFEAQIQAVLNIAPGLQQALQLLCDGRRARGDIAGACALLESMASEAPELATVHFELGLLLREIGETERAMQSFSRVVELEPKHPHAWRYLGDALIRRGDIAAAADAYSRQLQSSAMDLTTLETVAALGADQVEAADSVLREYLNVQPTDLNAIEAYAALNLRAREFESAEVLYKRALDLAPGFLKARLGYVSALHEQQKSLEEIEQIDVLLADDPDNAEYLELKSLALSAGGRVEDAVAHAERLVQARPDRARAWLIYGHLLRVAGRQTACVEAYRKATELDPQLYEAWFGLATLKTFHFNPADVEFLKQAPGETATDEGRQFRCFALGKALEDVADYKGSFEQYRQGNALIRSKNPYDIRDVLQGVQREKRRFTRQYFEAHGKDGLPAVDPIFILGLPRSGSTLVEQILASHSMVEGCGELTALPLLVKSLESRMSERPGTDDGDAETYFQGVDLKALGREYLERSKPYRQRALPRFTDKMPSNFHRLGLILSVLPNAKIIDTRRHPLDCCLSNFKQVFPNLHDPSYDLVDIGRYYRAYVELLAHFDT
ncbi:MAG TPA: sulfotransferase, partial [Rhizomicrobium sp.]|nr:sulfotransferase [Rhizomicrobium sp.]